MDKSRKLDQLVGRVEDLLARLPDDRNPQTAALRTRVDELILEAWTAVATQRAEARAGMNGMVRSMEYYVRDHRRIALGAAALVAGLAGYLAGKSLRWFGS